MEDNKKKLEKKEEEKRIKEEYARAGRQILDIINKKRNTEKEEER